MKLGNEWQGVVDARGANALFEQIEPDESPGKTKRICHEELNV